MSHPRGSLLLTVRQDTKRYKEPSTLEKAPKFPIFVSQEGAPIFNPRYSKRKVFSIFIALFSKKRVPKVA